MTVERFKRVKKENRLPGLRARQELVEGLRRSRLDKLKLKILKGAVKRLRAKPDKLETFGAMDDKGRWYSLSIFDDKTFVVEVFKPSKKCGFTSWNVALASHGKSRLLKGSISSNDFSFDKPEKKKKCKEKRCGRRRPERVQKVISSKNTTPDGELLRSRNKDVVDVGPAHLRAKEVANAAPGEFLRRVL